MKFISGLALASCVAVGAFVSGCGQSGETPATENSSSTTTTTTTGNTAASNTATGNTASTPAGKPGKHLRLAFITNNASDFWTIAGKGTELAKTELKNVDVDFRIPANGSAAEQKQIIDDLISKGNDGMAISPKDPANQVQMLNDAAKQTLVFTQDSDAPTSNRTCYVGTDNHAAGLQAGEEIKKALPNGGKVMLFVGSLDAQNAKDRRQGILDAIKGSKVEVVDTRTDEADHAKAKSNVSDAMVKYPDLDCLVGLWSYNGPAIYSAVTDANKVGKIKIICFDEEDQTLAGIKSGAIVSTIVQNPFEFGHMSITMMATYLWGKKDVVPPSKKVIVPTRIINQSNEKDFEAKLNQLRGRTTK